MCTATWISRPGEYELHFNRDERLSRGPGQPPRIIPVGDAEAVVPKDTDEGGSWIGTNCHGLSLCVLNRYQDGEDPHSSRRYKSRGQMLISLLDSRSQADVRRRVHETSFSIYRPFSLAAFAPDRPPYLFEWNGRDLQVREIDRGMMPLVSSGYDYDTVANSRRALLRSRIARSRSIDSELLISYHRSHLPERGARSVCMHRDDARTVSYSRIEVDRERVLFHYAGGPPCESEVDPAVRLERAVD